MSIPHYILSKLVSEEGRSDDCTKLDSTLVYTKLDSKLVSEEGRSDD